MRIERTAVYVLSSLVAVLAGVLVLLATNERPIGLSIGTSLVAGGLSSIAFVAIRFFDDTDAARVMHGISHLFAKNDDSLLAIDHSLGALRHVMQESSSRGELRVFDRHPKEEVGEEISTVHGYLAIDAVGLTLRPFCRDWLATIIRRGDVKLRLLVQDPNGDLFPRVCHQESRETRTMLDDVRWVTRAALQLSAGEIVEGWDEVIRAPGLAVEIRWFRDYPTITMTRVGDVLYARARFLREGASHTRTFFERYSVDDAASFDTFRSYFEIAWESARVPTRADCSVTPSV
jgi:hypothetical protein